jgi:hypothetical protein
MMPKKPLLIFISLLAMASLTCSSPGQILGNLTGKTGTLSKITFCKDVTEDGKCVGESTSFPEGTTVVWAYFTYKDMKDGQKWSRVWKNDGELYDETRDADWSDGVEGWDAYSMEDPDGLSGSFTLTLYLGDKQVQEGSFEVAQSENANNSGGGDSGTETPGEDQTTGFPAFGPVTMAKGVSDESMPIDPTTNFDPGTTIVYGVFPYTNMQPDQAYSIEWTKDGEQLVRHDKKWDDIAEGMYQVSLEKTDGLHAGTYTLNLYIDNQIARAVSFEVQGVPTPEPQPTAALQNNPPDQPQPQAKQKTGPPDRPAAPEEVVDPGALKYWYALQNTNLPVLHSIYSENLQYWTRVKLVNDNPCGSDAIACARSSCDDRYAPVTIYLPLANVQNEPDYKVAMYLTHELTHGAQHYDGGKCGCTVQKEYMAFAAQLDYLEYSGHMDYVEEHWPGIWDNNGKVRLERIWNFVKKAYSGPKCPDY